MRSSSNYNDTQLAADFSELQNAGFFSDNNLAMVLAFTYYVPDPDCWLFVYTVYENMYTGGILVNPAKAFAFRPHIQETSAEKQLVLCDAIEFVLVLGLMAICGFETYLTIRGSEKKHLGLMRIAKFPNILVLIMFGALIYVLAATDALDIDSAGVFQGTIDPVVFSLSRYLNPYRTSTASTDGTTE